MKRNKLLLACAAAALLMLAGCFIFPVVEGSGFLTSTPYAYTGFTRVDASYGFKVSVRPGAAFSVTVISDDNLIEYLDVRQSNGVLIVSMQPGYTYSRVTLTAEIRMPVLTGLTLSGASEARVDPGFPAVSTMNLNLSGASTADFQTLGANALQIEASGASKASIGSLSANSLAANLSGGSSVQIAGAAGTETINASGGSEARLIDCTTGQAAVNLSGGSNGWVNIAAGGSVSLNASGGSILYYRGNPVFVSLTISGGSQIIKVF